MEVKEVRRKVAEESEEETGEKKLFMVRRKR